MAGFVIHHIAGCEFLKSLEKKGLILSDEDKKNFLRGNLIVDSSRLDLPKIGKPDCMNVEVVNEEYEKVKALCGETDLTSDLNLRYKYLKKYYSNLGQIEKIETHFRDENKVGKCIEYPEIDRFILKYTDLLKAGDFSTLGYLFHLYTDYVYFNELLNNATIFYDENNQITDEAKKVKFVFLPKLNITVPVGEVYVKRGDYSIYQDYTTMNKILLDKFSVDFPIDSLINSDNTFINPGIEEVDFSRIDDIVRKTKGYIDESYQLTDINLNVFNCEDVEDFISNISDKFIKVLNSDKLLNENGKSFFKNSL